MLTVLKDIALTEQHLMRNIDKNIDKALKTFEVLMRSLMLHNELKLFTEGFK